MLTMKKKKSFEKVFSYSLCRIKTLSKKLSFDLIKKKRLFKSEEKAFWNDLFIIIINMSYL